MFPHLLRMHGVPELRNSHDRRLYRPSTFGRVKGNQSVMIAETVFPPAAPPREGSLSAACSFQNSANTGGQHPEPFWIMMLH